MLLCWLWVSIQLADHVDTFRFFSLIMTDRVFLKHAKEEFVSNHSGGSITEINSVTTVALVPPPLSP
jgi:hypothetical protein